MARRSERTTCEPISSNTLHALEEEAQVANEFFKLLIMSIFMGMIVPILKVI